jgi:isocitrate dehydrogenase (NAD+)
MAPGANIGPKAAIFEAVHGSAPDIAGKGVANPLALQLAACLMLDHVGKSAIAIQIRRAVDRALRDDNVRTRDLGGKATTRDFTNAVIGRLSG